jgi:phage antirepressor YoqD-like protein
MFKRNDEIREAKGSIPNWVIAERLGVHENTLNRWMRKEMSNEMKQKILAAINEIKNELKGA